MSDCVAAPASQVLGRCHRQDPPPPLFTAWHEATVPRDGLKLQAAQELADVPPG